MCLPHGPHPPDGPEVLGSSVLTWELKRRWLWTLVVPVFRLLHQLHSPGEEEGERLIISLRPEGVLNLILPLAFVLDSVWGLFLSLSLGSVTLVMLLCDQKLLTRNCSLLYLPSAGRPYLTPVDHKKIKVQSTLSPWVNIVLTPS